MQTTQQIKAKLADEKDPLLYLDHEIARCAKRMSGDCANVQATIAAYTGRADKDELIDIQKLKEELLSVGEMYGEIANYLKVRKAEVKRLKRAEQLGKALEKQQSRPAKKLR